MFIDEDFIDFVVLMYGEDVVDLFKWFFEWFIVDVQDIDDDKYMFVKKFFEVSLYFWVIIRLYL